MAGTRLFIQSIVLIELLAVVAWSAFHGLCRKGDVLCQPSFLRPKENFGLPPLESMHRLPMIQVDKQPSLSNEKLQWTENPNATVLCRQTEESSSSVGQEEHLVWWCPLNNYPQDAPRVLVQQRKTVVYSNERQLLDIIAPKVVPPFPLRVGLVLEESKDVAQRAQQFSDSLQDAMARLYNWPCVEEIIIEMTVVPPITKKWVEAGTLAEEAGETLSEHLPPLNEREAWELRESLELNETTRSDIILYIPLMESVEASSFQIGNSSQLLMVGNWEATIVSQFLSRKMGIPVELLEADSTFPGWYEEWYWYQVSRALSADIQAIYSRVEHLLEEPLKLRASSNLRGEYHSLQELKITLEALLKTSRIHSDFPLEHYAAIFAPLLFPLLLPFLVGTLKELRRYKRKQEEDSKKGEDAKKGKED